MSLESTVILTPALNIAVVCDFFFPLYFEPFFVLFISRKIRALRLPFFVFFLRRELSVFHFCLVLSFLKSRKDGDYRQQS